MIDVVIPCRNAPEALALTLNYFWANAYDPRLVASVTVLDNCSTDARIPALLRQVRARFPKTHQVLLNETNVGVWCSVNRGLAFGKSEFIFVLTSDVLLEPNVLPSLFDVLITDQTLGNIGPDVKTGLGEVANLTGEDREASIDRTTYNGAAWMMRRSLLDAIGWYDPSFYVSYGDTDYMERMKVRGIGYGILRGRYCVHLDKQTRRADGGAYLDSEREMKDAKVFAAKWAGYPDVVRRHTPGLIDHMVMWKERHLGGWEAARVQ